MNKGKALWWAMSLLQWSLIALVQNIDNLEFRSITMLGSATISVKFNQTKTNQTIKIKQQANIVMQTHSTLHLLSTFVWWTQYGQRISYFVFIKKRSQINSAHKEIMVIMLRCGLRNIGIKLLLSFVLITLMYKVWGKFLQWRHPQFPRHHCHQYFIGGMEPWSCTGYLF